MRIDKTTLKDLTILSNPDGATMVDHLNHCLTVNGREQLYLDLQTPLNSPKKIKEVQDVLKTVMRNKPNWAYNITNGTIMVMEKFYTTGVAALPADSSVMSIRMYQLSNTEDYAIVKYSMLHFFDFIKGMFALVDLLDNEDSPELLREVLNEIKIHGDRPVMQLITSRQRFSELNPSKMMRMAYFFQHQFKRQTIRLMEVYAQLDAWFGMATSIEKYNYSFPEVEESNEPYFIAEDLYHPLLEDYVSYDITLNKEKNFLFLTGANMAGKSTFIKAVGISTYLAHVGMGVPAKSLKLNYFEGMLSNINVMDNILKGESYFFNEVKRIKNTVELIKDGKHWLVLIDELFKGTNVQDAMKCSSAVIEGLLKIHNSLFILSTHLYEIGHDLTHHPNITFYYFETEAAEDELKFSYKLKPGISNDRLGYLILKREGVVKLLEEL